MSIQNLLNQFLGAGNAAAGAATQGMGGTLSKLSNNIPGGLAGGAANHPAERTHLEQLVQALQLPPDLAQQLQQQARQVLTQAA